MPENREINNILICGVGGVGGYFGGRIAHYVSHLQQKKYNVSFLARGLHLERIKERGLELHTSDGRILICQPTLASDNIDDFPAPDLCLICVKSYDLDGLIVKLRENVIDTTIFISLMNGIDIYDRIRKNLQKGVVFPTCVYLGSHIDNPGLIIQTGNPGFFRCGFDPKYPNYKPQAVIDLFEEMDIQMEWLDDSYPAIWEKYLLVASFALVCAYTGQTLGKVIDDKHSIEILRKIMQEIVNIASQKTIRLPKNIIEDTIEFCKDYPDVKPSYLRDIEKGGKNEGDLFGGAIIRMGKELGVDTSITKKIYEKLK